MLPLQFLEGVCISWLLVPPSSFKTFRVAIVRLLLLSRYTKLHPDDPDTSPTYITAKAALPYEAAFVQSSED